MTTLYTNSSMELVEAASNIPEGADVAGLPGLEVGAATPEVTDPIITINNDDDTVIINDMDAETFAVTHGHGAWAADGTADAARELARSAGSGASATRPQIETFLNSCYGTEDGAEAWLNNGDDAMMEIMAELAIDGVIDWPAA